MNILEKNPCTNLIATVKNTKEKELITNDDIKLIVGSSTRIAQSRLMVGDYRNDQVKDLVLLLLVFCLMYGLAGSLIYYFALLFEVTIPSVLEVTPAITLFSLIGICLLSFIKD